MTKRFLAAIVVNDDLRRGATSSGMTAPMVLDGPMNRVALLVPMRHGGAATLSLKSAASGPSSSRRGFVDEDQALWVEVSLSCLVRRISSNPAFRLCPQAYRHTEI
jgi:hypothetical protein